MRRSISTIQHLTNRISVNLLANLLQGLIAIVLIPLTTYVLGPEDYGVYGMAVVLIGLAIAFCEMGASYVIYSHYPMSSEVVRSELQFTLLALALLLGIVAAAVVWFAWPLLIQYIPLLSELSQLEMLLLCSSIPLKTMLTTMYPILIIRQRSEWLAISLLVQSIVNASVILACLYLLEAGRSALFWGQWIGLLVCIAVPLMLLGRTVWAPLRLEWLLKVRGVAVGAWFSGLIEQLHATLESALIVRSVGSDALGNYNHARAYQGILMLCTKAFANVLWPIALNEAHESDGRFARIRPAWDIVYLGLACTGVALVLFGDDIVNLMTHGKFVQAGEWLPLLMVYLLLQHAGRPATATLYAAHKGNSYSAIRIVSLLVAMAALFVWVPVYGVLAVLVVSIAAMLLTRVLIAWWARRQAPVPFQDHWVVAGCLMIAVAWLLQQAWVPSVAERLAGLLSVVVFCIIATVIIVRGNL